jgi:hypothetical protein
MQGEAATTAAASEAKHEADEDAMLGPQLLESLKFAVSPRRQMKSEKFATARADRNLEFMARLFFRATTKLSDDQEDILPQEDSESLKLSVYFVFSELFPAEDVTEGLHQIVMHDNDSRADPSHLFCFRHK